MKLYKTEQKIKEVTTLVSKTCDLCKVVANLNGDWPTYGHSFNCNETEVRCKQGVQYPEGGSGSETEVDICSDCFHSRLLPWLRKQGATINTTEWDY